MAKGKGFEGGFPESSGLGNYRIGNLGEKRKPEPEIQIDQSEEKSRAVVTTKTANPTFLQHNQSDNISYNDITNKNYHI